MNTFASAVENRSTLTENGMPARATTGTACLDMFFHGPVADAKECARLFTGAVVENQELARRLALWLRDIRGGAGMRENFRVVLRTLEYLGYDDILKQIIPMVPEVGRWDDLLVFKEGGKAEELAFDQIHRGLMIDMNKLCAKWMPRKGPVAARLRKYMDVAPKAWRKWLVTLSREGNVVEQKMCANEWTEINYSHVPSKAATAYRQAFNRHDPKGYADYMLSLQKKDGTAKINAAAIFPHDAIKSVFNLAKFSPESIEDSTLSVVAAQWDALPNYVGDARILPMVDVSGSMEATIPNTNVSCMLAAVALGLYCSEKNTGPFKDVFLTFSERPNFVTVKGNIVERIAQMGYSDWGFNTNFVKALSKILAVALEGNVPQEKMPETLLVLSDMQFDESIDDNRAAQSETALAAIKRKFTAAGYEVPQIVFWNLRATTNVPAEKNEHGVALISGFSPSVLKAVLANDMEEISPQAIMLDTLMVPRYDAVT